MTEYAPASGQDRNPSYYSNPHHISPHYTNGNGTNYFHPQAPNPYSTSIAHPYSNYPSHYIPSTQQPSNHHLYMPTTSTMQYQTAPPPRYTRTLAYPDSAYHTAPLPTQRLTTAARMYSGDLLGPAELEPQDSVNESTLLSEPILPPLEGYPVVKDFDQVIQQYVNQLSPKKRDKALISARRARNIRTVLMDKKTTSIESAQFRFWVKKMFCLQQVGSSTSPKSICHDHKPVAVREKLFKILTRAHKACQHGGRDKTSLQVRRVYSWVPKELISRFVKICPTCKIRRPSRSEDTDMAGCADDDDQGDEDCDDESPSSRRPSTTKNGSTSSMPLGFSPAFAQQNRWMSDLPSTKIKNEHYDHKTKHEYYDTMTTYATHDNHEVTSPHHYGRLSQQMHSMSFSDAAMSGIISPSGFPSSSVRSTGNWHDNSAYQSAYSGKHGNHGEYVKQEHRM